MTRSDHDTTPSPDSQARRIQSVRGTKGDSAKEARVKAALKANIARRKAQARARAEDEDSDD
ncbi:MAG: hypothetical protein R3D60_14435 [Paracoccaceae bacterium]